MKRLFSYNILSGLCILLLFSCNRYSPTWEEYEDRTKYDPLQTVLGIPDIRGTEIDNTALLRSVTDSYGMMSDTGKDQSALLQNAIDDMAKH